MDLYEVMRTTPASREFTGDPVPDDVLYQILEHARFAPSGDNRQGWRIVVVRDRDTRRRLREFVQTGWREYAAQMEAGLVPFAADEGGSFRSPRIDLAAARETPRPFAGFDHLDEAPVLMLLCADLGVLSFVDAMNDRISITGGGSIYPFAHNVLLAARNEGLGGVMVTLICREEPAVKALLGVPDRFAVAGLIALGTPVREITRLRRRAVEAFATVDRFDGPAFTSG